MTSNARRARLLLLLVAATLACGAGSGSADPGSRQPQPIRKAYFGLHILSPSRLREWPPIGFGSWRLWDTEGITWAYINPEPSEWVFGPLDQAVEQGQAAGVELVMTLGQTPAWASSRPAQPSPRGPGSAAPPAGLDAWVRYVETVVTRYRGRIRAYEIWNEPRIEGLDRWRDTQFFYGSAQELVALSKAAYSVIKRRDPDALVLSPAFDGEGLGEKRLGAFLAAGGGCCFDVLSYHLYPHTGATVEAIRPERMPGRVARLRAILAKAGLARPIWNTEYGYLHQESGKEVRPLQPEGFLSVVLPPDVARAYVARSLILGAAAGIERLFWYAWDTHQMSLLTASPDRRPSSAASAYGEIVRWLANGRVYECESSANIWNCRYQGPVSCSGRLYWTTGASARVTMTESFDRIRRLDGSDGPLAKPATLDLGMEPVLVYSGNPPATGCFPD